MYRQVNGVNLYYERYGRGRSILLLHGNGENHQIFNRLTHRLKRHFTVYALDSRDHGKSSKVEKLRYEDMAEDVVAFIGAEGLEKPILCGFSDGGIVGLLVASGWPGLLAKLVVCGANTRVDGICLRDLTMMRLGYLLSRDAKLEMILTQHDIPEERLRKICTPTLVLAGSRDLIRREHTEQLAGTLPNSWLRILPGEDHLSYVRRGERLYRVMLPFLAAELPGC